MQEQANSTYKVIFVGDSFVGKTSMIARYTTNSFTELTNPTVGAAYISQTVEINQQKVTLCIWDTAGQEKYRYLVPMYYRSASVAAVVFDVNNANSLESVKFWIEDVKKSVSSNISFVLVANKIDLERVIPEDDVRAVADMYSMQYVETSALNGVGINNLFDLIKKLISDQQKQEEAAHVSINENYGKSCC